MSLRSGLYSGVVVHERGRPRRHRLRYRVFMLLLDLDELDAAGQRLRLFSHNALNLLSYHDRDHAGRQAAPVKPQIEALLAARGLGSPGGRILALCMPRLLGHGFNPLTVYFCHDRDERLAAVVYAVSNTFGERHDYVLPATARDDGLVVQGCDKTFYVSPFLPMDLRYAFAIVPPGQGVRVGVDVHDDEGRVLSASFAGRREPLTDRALLRAALAHPWQVAGVLAAIHWEAVKILLKGFGFFANPRRAKEKAARTEVRAASRSGERDALSVSTRSARP
ncbi:DUF1365 domain-containing protein [Caulobacter flavus]|uniref:DUF1365 domain-containing protein n=1 Tax=Caulobacter flavus TaxID=1679497 RepID=A0A2N5CW82_9CAUL|nr:DUF1365 family protein [Caulobacter flavus]AYV44944.1 DUF1365 domain-containing protein [Caulobacter flavus]PLR18051.1 DUF1365 domain-containing protein [Caulobacter flavus]